MKKNIKDYMFVVPTYLVLILMIVLPTLLSMIYTNKIKSDAFKIFTFVLVIITVMLILASIGEAIYLIFDVYKRKKMDSGEKLIWYLLLFCLNIFIAPYYYLKYVKKKTKNKKNTKKVNLLYPVTIIILCVIGTYTSMYSSVMYNNYIGEKEKQKQAKLDVTTIIPSNDNSFEITFKTGHKKEIVSEYDLYVKNTKKKIVTGAFLYDVSNYEEKTLDAVLNKQVEYIKNSKQDVKDYKETKTRSYNNKTIMSAYLSGKTENTSECIYVLSTISFEGKDNNIIYVIQIVPKQEYKNLKSELIEIVNSINLKI